MQVFNLPSRARHRAGRRVRYFPTAAEVVTYGVGPFDGTVTAARPSGNCDLSIVFPAPIAGYGVLDGTYTAPELAAIVDHAARRRNDVPRGNRPGTFTFVGT